MKSDASTPASTESSATSTSRSASNASPRASADTSLPYRLTDSEIESLRQDFKDAEREIDELFADVKPLPRGE